LCNSTKIDLINYHSKIFLDRAEPESGYENGEFTRAQTSRSRRRVPRGRGCAPAALAAGRWHPAHAATDMSCRRLRLAARSSWFTSHGQCALASAAAARRTAAQPSAPGASNRGAEPRTDPSDRGLICRPAAAAACWVEAAAAGRESRRGTGGQTGTPAHGGGVGVGRRGRESGPINCVGPL